ncbi:MAG: hypothetical protein II771_09480 [Clostridia bacterium]|nr:hypothetical protein [Clostridia bacterium]
MENKQDRRLDTILILLVALVGVALSLITFFWRLQNRIQSFLLAEEGIFYLFLFYYGIRGYKKPHGNALRYLVLVLAAVTAASIQMQLDYWSVPWPVVLSNGLAAVLMGYMAGRLHKVKENRWTVAAVTVLLLVRSFWPIGQQYAALSVFCTLTRITTLFSWITVVLIYFFRYREHREAGLAADAESKR